MELVIIVLGAIAVVAVFAFLIVRTRRAPSGRPLDTPQRVEARVEEMADSATPEAPRAMRESERRDASGLRAPDVVAETRRTP